MKGLPNLVTSIRVAASGALIFAAPFSAAFWALYALAGLSDMLDGFLARGLHAETAAGARLDSAADFCFLAVCTAKLLPVLRLPGWQRAWIAAIFVLRLAVLALGLYRRIPVPLHTQANRLTGLALFLFPAALRFVPAAAAVPFLCALAAFAAAQECGSVCRMSGVFRGALRRKK